MIFIQCIVKAGKSFLPAILAFLSASVFSSILIAILGYSPVTAFISLFEGALGDAYNMSESLIKASPLIFTGLSVILSFRAGIWNIGAEGQFLMGSLACGWVALNAGEEKNIMTAFFSISAACVAGGLWGSIAGWLREKRGVSEVITTIMLNQIALYLLSFAVHGPLQEKAGHYPQSDRLQPFLQLHKILPETRLHSGILIGILLAMILTIILFRSPFGFKLRVIGQNTTTAFYSRIAISPHIIATMAISGAIAGLGGALQFMGVTYRLYENFSPGYGYTAIAVALLARLHPLGVLPASLLFGALETGAKSLQRTMSISPVLAEVIQAMVILFVVLFETSWFWNIWKKKMR